MKKILMKAFCFLLAIGYSGVVIAQAGGGSCCCPVPPEPKCAPDCNACEICPPCKPCEPCCTEVPVIGDPCNCAYNAPARIDPLCGWDTWFSLSFIYWQANETGLDLGLHVSGEDDYNFDFETINMDFDYQPGFKIGAGMSFCRDNWTLYLEYTRLKFDDSRTYDITSIAETSEQINILTSGWFPMLSTSQEAFALELAANTQQLFDFLRSRWEVDYNTFDLELGRPYYLGTKLIFKPHFGLRAGWLDQEYNMYGINTLATQVGAPGPCYSDNEEDSWFIGPRVGLDSDWLFCYNFRIFGNVAGSLTYQNFEITSVQSKPYATSTPPNTYVARDELNCLTPNVEFALGLGYGSYLCNNTWYFDLTVGYDFHCLWNQNMMKYLVDYVDLGALKDYSSGALKLHGLTISARLDF